MANQEQITHAGLLSRLVVSCHQRPCRAIAEDSEGTGQMSSWHGYGSFVVVTIGYSSNQRKESKGAQPSRGC